MDRAEFDFAVEAAREIYRVAEYLLQDPPASLAAVARREFDGAILPAWIREAEDRERRSKIFAEAVNRIDPRLDLQAPTRQGPHPERDASRNVAALAAVWYLSERCGLKTVTRNLIQKGVSVPNACFEGGSVCDAVGVARGWNFKTALRIYTGKRKLIRCHQALFMTLWAELPSAAWLGVPQRENY